jgi:hypothetical protein
MLRQRHEDYKPQEKVRIVGYSEASANAYGEVLEVTNTGVIVTTIPFGGNLPNAPFNFVEVAKVVVTHKDLAREEAVQTVAHVGIDSGRFINTYQYRLLRILHNIQLGTLDPVKYSKLVLPVVGSDLSYNITVPELEGRTWNFPLTPEGVGAKREQELHAALTAIEFFHGVN